MEQPKSSIDKKKLPASELSDINPFVGSHSNKLIREVLRQHTRVTIFGDRIIEDGDVATDPLENTRNNAPLVN